MTALIALDEIFTSTNYKSVAGSYSIKYIFDNYQYFIINNNTLSLFNRVRKKKNKKLLFRY